MKKFVLGALLLLAAACGGLVLIYQNQSTQTSAMQSVYVAMGDSVAAGLGLEGRSDTSDCGRTGEAYSQAVATARGYKLVSVACSGASLQAGLIGSQTVRDQTIESQLAQLFKQPDPALITITAGVNDINWTAILRDCYTGTCGGTAQTTQVSERLQTVSLDMQSLIASVQDHYGASAPPIIVTGYYQLFPKNLVANCTELTNIDDAERIWGRQLQDNINAAVRQGTQGFDNVSFVAPDFDNHELCTSDSWIQTVSSEAPFHPTADGQAALAAQIELTIRQSQARIFDND